MLIAKFKYNFLGSYTLKNDNQHVGLIDTKNKKIVIASPWNYGREHTLLHEIGHLVWAKFVDDDLRKQWESIVKATKMEKEDRQNAEELWCHAYASHFAKNKITKFSHPTWEKFVKKVCQ